MKLEDIGFYTLENKRAENTSETSPLWRCELLVTARCNFNCTYCRKFLMTDISVDDGFYVINKWASNGLKNIRFSGGEPTLHPHLIDFVKYAKTKGVQRIAISTNGSAEESLYSKLLDAGVNDFSISLDSCCQKEMEDLSGGTCNKKIWDKLLYNIEWLSSQTYVTLGVVVTQVNINSISTLITRAVEMGVSDVRIITASQWLPWVNIPIGSKTKFPILNYRMTSINNHVPMRGLGSFDCNRCKLVLDDMCVVDGYHYPCIIYFREQGKPIGKFSGIKNVREQRRFWAENHNTHSDNICLSQCLDVCRDYNNYAITFLEINE